MDVLPFQFAAAIHERHAAWLRGQRKDPTEAIRLSLDFLGKAFKCGPLYPRIFATRGDLYLVQAKAASTNFWLASPKPLEQKSINCSRILVDRYSSISLTSPPTGGLSRLSTQLSVACPANTCHLEMTLLRNHDDSFRLIVATL